MKILNILLAIIISTITGHAWADVPQIDPWTKEYQSQFAKGQLPTLNDLTIIYRWQCTQYSALPGETSAKYTEQVSIFNSFNGQITSTSLYRGYPAWETDAWVESADHKSLERVYSDKYNLTAGDDTRIPTVRHVNLRVYKHVLISETSIEILPSATKLFSIDIGRYGHAISDRNRAVAFYTVCY